MDKLHKKVQLHPGFELIPMAGFLEIDYKGNILDIDDFIEIQFTLSQIIHRTAAMLTINALGVEFPIDDSIDQDLHNEISAMISVAELSKRNLMEDPRDHTDFKILPFSPRIVSYYGFNSRLIQPIISNLSIGSLNQIIHFAIGILANPDVRAVIQNLVANVIWSFYTPLRDTVGTYLRKADQKRFEKGIIKGPDTFYITPMVIKMYEKLISNNPYGGSLFLRHYQSPWRRETELEIRLKLPDEDNA